MRLRGRLRGCVQGVGMRPHLARLAHGLGLAGFARNDGRGVIVEVEGEPAAVEQFRASVTEGLPPAAAVDEVSWHEVVPCSDREFVLEESRAEGQRRFALPPDLASCPACLDEVLAPGARRHDYPFASCSDCGPRYTIVRELPYDRVRTTMDAFPLCAACRGEMEDPTDRRFHAQTLACPACGPRLELLDRAGRRHAVGTDALDTAALLLRRGEIVALKGLGGFQLLVDATDRAAVSRLRTRKERPEKPFAVLFRDLDAVKRAAACGPAEVRALTSAAAPIVLLRGLGDTLAPEVAPGTNRVGAMLPTTPLHRLLAERVRWPLVCTSGNRREEPIAIGNAEALERLAGLADAFLVHDRDIHARMDDGVVHVVGDRSRVLRAGRGLAPLEITLDVPAGTPPMLALGAHLKAAPAVLEGTSAVLGPHVGDLDGLATREAFAAAARALPELLAMEPEVIVCDAHPDYASTLLGERLAAGERQLMRVHHHHAHAAACMAEHGLESCLAFTWDGAGLGPDGSIWGGEVLRVSAAGAERVTHLHPFPLPGGDRAARDAGRPLAGVLTVLGLAAADLDPRLLHLAARTPVQTTSAGRLFDAVAALLGVRPDMTFEGQAAMALEDLAVHHGQPLEAQPFPFAVGRTLDWRPMLRQIAADRTDAPHVSARFHATLAHMIRTAARGHPGEPIVLTGGCFQNRLLAATTLTLLEADGRTVFLPARVPPGDGGLALGQLWVCSRRRVLSGSTSASRRRR